MGSRFLEVVRIGETKHQAKSTSLNQQRTNEPATKMKNENSYFENNISNEVKLRFISLIGPSVLANQQAVALALAHHGAGARIDASKRACAERWERRERQEIAARLTASC